MWFCFVAELVKSKKKLGSHLQKRMEQTEQNRTTDAGQCCENPRNRRQITGKEVIYMYMFLTVLKVFTTLPVPEAGRQMSMSQFPTSLRHAIFPQESRSFLF